jgi:hypothetical protein
MKKYLTLIDEMKIGEQTITREYKFVTDVSQEIFEDMNIFAFSDPNKLFKVKFEDMYIEGFEKETVEKNNFYCVKTIENMNNDKATINGLMDGISVLENNNTNEQPCNPSDRIYNEEEPISFGIEINEKMD